MKLPKSYCKLYCENCDQYNHDLAHCKEFHELMEEFKRKGELAMIERFEKCSTYQQVLDVENAMIAALKE